MARKKAKKAASKTILLVLAIIFVVLFLVLLTLSILSIVYANASSEPKECVNGAVRFFSRISKFEIMGDPVSIFIQILSSIGGVFFGIRIGQWIDEKEEKEKLVELWGRISNFLSKLKLGIADSRVSIRELAEYEIYWDSLQRADNIATQLLQEDARYIDISFAFSFLTFYNHSWANYNEISEWLNNAPTKERERVEKWIGSLDDLISYTANKARDK